MLQTTYIKNAVIERTFLGKEDHGILTLNLSLNYGDGSCQGFGGMTLDVYSKKEDRRIGHAYGTECLLRILEVVGVESWEELKGKNIRVETDSSSWDGKIIAIGNILSEKWFNPGETLREIREKEKCR